MKWLYRNYHFQSPFRDLPTATQLASVCAGTFNPAQTSPLTLSTLHGLTRRSHAEGAGGAWLLVPLGRRWTERCSRQVTCSGPGHRRVCAPAGRAPRRAGHEGGRLRTVAFPPGGTCRGRPRAPSCPTHRGPGSAAARRGVPGAAWASESRPLPPRRVQKDARLPALPRRRSDWKGERSAGVPGSPGSHSAAGTGPGAGSARLRGPSTAARARARDARGPQRAGGLSVRPRGAPGNAGGHGARICWAEPGRLLSCQPLPDFPRPGKRGDLGKESPT